MNLQVSDVSKSFDGTTALKGVSLGFPAGSITTIVGPNGSGKTTLFNIISGFIAPDTGSVFLGPDNIVGRPAYIIASSGIARLFQRPRIFPGLSVIDNLQVAANGGVGEYPLKALIHLRKVLRERGETLKQAHEMASLLGLGHLSNDAPLNLSYGQMKLLAIGQLLMRRSAVLLLDELTAGLDDSVLSNLLQILLRVKDQGRTVVLIEHRWELTSPISDAMAILSGGVVVANGVTSDVRTVLSSYESVW
jgi:ABC-type branched-subunit amino acid transport system ATPase component